MITQAKTTALTMGLVTMQPTANPHESNLGAATTQVATKPDALTLGAANW